MDFNLNRLNAYLIVFLVWAGIYLPGLGTLEINFNEGRRIMPAVEMLDSGNWRVPSLAGEEYFKKPPMINWLIASSFNMFGARSDFAARFPSALAMLAFVTLLVLMPSPFLDIRTRLVSAVIFLTCIACFDSGRHAEIDSVHASVSGMAMLSWLNLWAGKRRSTFGLWFVPSLIIGFGLLLKGPIILFFFYALVLSVLAHEKKLKELISFHHLIGIVIMLGIFASWAMTVSASGPSSGGTGAKMAGIWFSEIMMRFRGDELNFAKWPLRTANAFLSMLPWLLFAPLLFSRSIISKIPECDRNIFRGCRFALLAALIIVNLTPATKARYSMPVYGLALTLIGWTLLYAAFPRIEKMWRNIIQVLSGILSLACIVSFAVIFTGAGNMIFISGEILGKVDIAVQGIRSSYLLIASGGLIMLASVAMFAVLMWKRDFIRGNFALVLASGALAVALNLSVAVFALPVMAQFQEGNEVLAGNINLMTKGGTLYAYRTDCDPFLFYIKPGVRFIRHHEQIGENVKFMIYQGDLQEELDRSGALAGRGFREISRFKHRRTEYVLLGLD